MIPGSVCRHLKIAGRVTISRFFHITRPATLKVATHPSWSFRNLSTASGRRRSPCRSKMPRIVRFYETGPELLTGLGCHHRYPQLRCGLHRQQRETGRARWFLARRHQRDHAAFEPEIPGEHDQLGCSDHAGCSNHSQGARTGPQPASVRAAGGYASSACHPILDKFCRCGISASADFIIARLLERAASQLIGTPPSFACECCSQLRGGALKRPSSGANL